MLHFVIRLFVCIVKTSFRQAKEKLVTECQTQIVTLTTLGLTRTHTIARFYFILFDSILGNTSFLR